MKRTTLIILALLFSLHGCSTASTSPQWSTGVADDYPASRYLTAVGEGASREIAEQRALAALARVFEVNISEQNSDFSLFRSAIGETPESSNRQVSSRHLIAATEQLIEGASPVEYWQHKQQHLVLVALERNGAEQRLRQKIGQLDQQTSGLTRYAAREQLNTVVRISALEQALQLQHQRTSLNRNLSVVSAKQITAPISLAELEQRIRDQLAGLRFQLAADEEWLPLLQHAVGQIGARVLSGSELQLSGTVDREPVTQRQGWFWLRGSLLLTLSNSAGTVITQQRLPVKLSAQQAGLIEQRLLDRINSDIANQLYRLLTSSRVAADQ